jgi:hypothetical protein
MILFLKQIMNPEEEIVLSNDPTKVVENLAEGSSGKGR